MELKTYEDFNKHWFDKVYLFNTEIQYYDYDNTPYFDKVRNGELDCKYMDYGNKIANYIVHDDFFEQHWFDLDASGVIKGGHIKVFTDEKEANKFANKYIKKHKKELEQIREEVKKCTVTREQIAEKFGIPLNKLVIVDYQL